MRFFIGGIIIWRFFYAGTLTVFQYFVFLPPFREPNFFFRYVWTHFLLNFILSVGAALAFYLFLKFLKKRNERFFEEGEMEIGLICALIAGWPNFVVFIPLVFILVALESVFRKIFFKESLTALGLSFFLAAMATFVWGDKIINILGLGVLKI